MRRRDFLRMGVCAPAVLTGCSIPLTLEQGFLNECRGPHRHAVLRDPRVLEAWEGVRPAEMWDCHAHLFGNGRSGSGLYIDPDLDRPQSMMGRVRRTFFLNAGCIGDEDDERLDQAMVARLTHVVSELPKGAKAMVLAFDFTYDDSGKQRKDLTTFAVPDAYARRVAASRPDRFEWIASIHPYRADAIEALEAARLGGARAVKWLPPAMNVDMANRRCIPFYEALRRLDIPLLVHVGEEQAVAGAKRHDLSSPQFLRHPLEHGVRVIAAHCASLGAGNFELFSQLMADKRYVGRLFGDISAVTQLNRAPILPTLLSRTDWEGRLLNGSDYPLPGMMPIFSLKALESAGILEEARVPLLRELREVNPLVFDFVLKRSLRHNGRAFPASVFETRGFFEKAA